MENLVPTNQLKRQKSSKSTEPTTEPTGSVDRYSELVAAWGAGKFNSGDADATVAEFFGKDIVLDVASGAGHTSLAAAKIYHYEDVKTWFAFVGQLDIADLELSFVAGPKPCEVWGYLSSPKTTYRPTGKGLPVTMFFTSTWEGAKCTKMTVLYGNAAAVAAACSDSDAVPTVATLPTFEPHPDPKAAYDNTMAVWATGEFSKPETKQEALKKHFAADCVIDATSGLQPDVFKVYEGLEGVDAWTNGVVGTWELSNMIFEVVTGVKQGCVVQRVTFDATLKETGKAATGIETYQLLAYNSQGQMVYMNYFFANPVLAASIYDTEVAPSYRTEVAPSIRYSVAPSFRDTVDLSYREDGLAEYSDV